MKPMNKYGKKGGNRTIVTVIVVLAVFALLAYLVVNVTNTQVPGITSGNGGSEVLSAGCNTAPTIDISIVDALNKGTSTTATWSAIKNGLYIGSISSATTFTPNDKVQILLSNSTSYIDVTTSEKTLGCGVNPINAEMYANTTATVTLKNDAGTATLTNAATGGAVNASAIGLGGSAIYPVELKGIDRKSTGKLTYVVELGTDANVSSVTLSDSNGNPVKKLSSVPSGLTVSGNNLYRVAFEIPSINGAVKKVYNLAVQAASQKAITGAVYTTFYVNQPFVQPDGSFSNGVSDTDGNTKYMDNYGYNFFVTA